MGKRSMVGFEEGNNWREYEGKSNPSIPYETVSHLWTHLKTFTASEESPAVLARGKPMNPTGEANEGGSEETSQKGGGQLGRNT
jgi:hypothetical protein